MKPEEQMLISAVRYASGRMSYIVGVTCEFVLSVKPKLSQQCINIIIRDIEEELARCYLFGKTLSFECDEEAWKKLLVELKEGQK